MWDALPGLIYRVLTLGLAVSCGVALWQVSEGRMAFGWCEESAERWRVSGWFSWFAHFQALRRLAKMLEPWQVPSQRTRTTNHFICFLDGICWPRRQPAHGQECVSDMHQICIKARYVGMCCICPILCKFTVGSLQTNWRSSRLSLGRCFHYFRLVYVLLASLFTEEGWNLMSYLVHWCCFQKMRPKSARLVSHAILAKGCSCRRGKVAETLS